MDFFDWLGPKTAASTPKLALTSTEQARKENEPARPHVVTGLEVRKVGPSSWEVYVRRVEIKFAYGKATRHVSAPVPIVRIGKRGATGSLAFSRAALGLSDKDDRALIQGKVHRFKTKSEAEMTAGQIGRYILDPKKLNHAFTHTDYT